jgi:hypothetical protein
VINARVEIEALGTFARPLAHTREKSRHALFVIKVASNKELLSAIHHERSGQTTTTHQSIKQGHCRTDLSNSPELFKRWKSITFGSCLIVKNLIGKLIQGYTRVPQRKKAGCRTKENRRHALPLGILRQILCAKARKMCFAL